MGKGKPGRTRGGRVAIANMGANRKAGSRHQRRAEAAKQRLEAKGYSFPEWMK